MTEFRPARTDDVRVSALRPLIPAAILLEQVPLDSAAESFVLGARRDVARIVEGTDDRLLVVVGPCSIHDVDAARDYAARLAELSGELEDALLPVMRVYFEKPRTTVGWKGLINDPHLDGSFRINDGLTIARHLLCDLAVMGVRSATEFLDTISPQFIADTIAWGAIGARTTESQVHRELASGLSMPMGFKNGTDGSVRIAVDAVVAARHPHAFLGVTKQGIAAIVQTEGNPECHVILRGSSQGPNYAADAVAAACDLLRAGALRPSVMVDCSHGNSRKDHTRQLEVARDVASRVARGDHSVFGLMIESHLLAGRQDPGPRDALVYGRSITDACIGWDETAEVLRELAQSVRERRKLAPDEDGQ
jgi:3-deoxy-7-phosphoheptulonate synthase